MGYPRRIGWLSQVGVGSFPKTPIDLMYNNNTLTRGVGFYIVNYGRHWDLLVSRALLSLSSSGHKFSIKIVFLMAMKSARQSWELRAFTSKDCPRIQGGPLTITGFPSTSPFHIFWESTLPKLLAVSKKDFSSLNTVKVISIYHSRTGNFCKQYNDSTSCQRQGRDTFT